MHEQIPQLPQPVVVSPEEQEKAFQVTDAARQQMVDSLHERYRSAEESVREVMASSNHIEVIDSYRRWLEQNGSDTTDMNDEQIIRSIYLRTHVQTTE